MRKLLGLLSILLMCSGFTISNNTGSSLYSDSGIEGTPTDYTQDANCVFAYAMNSSDTETDRSGNGYTLTEYDDNIATTADAPSGYTQISRDFSGGSLTSSGNLNVAADSEMTFCFWFNSDGTHSGYIIDMYNSDDGGSLRINLAWDGGGGTGQTYGYIYNNGWTVSDRVDCNSGGIPDSGTWVHVAYVCDSTSVRCYINGSVQTDTDTSPPDFGNTKFPIVIGNRYDHDGSYDLNGQLCEVILLKTALTPTQINEIKDHGINGRNGDWS